MSFGASAPPLILEGEYSTWTKKWVFDFPEDLQSTSFVAMTFSPKYVCIIYSDNQLPTRRNRFCIVNITDGSIAFISPSNIDYATDHPKIDTTTTFFLFNTLVWAYAGGAFFSIMSKYQGFVLYGDAQLEVWKEGAKVWTSPLASEVVDGATAYDDIGMRYDGKYVIAVTDNKKLVCFEGS